MGSTGVESFGSAFHGSDLQDRDANVDIGYHDNGNIYYPKDHCQQSSKELYRECVGAGQN